MLLVCKMKVCFTIAVFGASALRVAVSRLLGFESLLPVSRCFTAMST